MKIVAITKEKEKFYFIVDVGKGGELSHQAFTDVVSAGHYAQMLKMLNHQVIFVTGICSENVFFKVIELPVITRKEINKILQTEKECGFFCSCKEEVLSSIDKICKKEKKSRSLLAYADKSKLIKPFDNINFTYLVEGRALYRYFKCNFENQNGLFLFEREDKIRVVLILDGSMAHFFEMHRKEDRKNLDLELYPFLKDLKISKLALLIIGNFDREDTVLFFSALYEFEIHVLEEKEIKYSDYALEIGLCLEIKEKNPLVIFADKKENLLKKISTYACLYSCIFSLGIYFLVSMFNHFEKSIFCTKIDHLARSNLSSLSYSAVKNEKHPLSKLNQVQKEIKKSKAFLLNKQGIKIKEVLSPIERVFSKEEIGIEYERVDFEMISFPIEENPTKPFIMKVFIKLKSDKKIEKRIFEKELKNIEQLQIENQGDSYEISFNIRKE